MVYGCREQLRNDLFICLMREMYINILNDFLIVYNISMMMIHSHHCRTMIIFRFRFSGGNGHVALKHEDMEKTFKGLR